LSHILCYGDEDLTMGQSHFMPKNNFSTENMFMRLKDNLRDLIKSNGITVAHLSRATKTPLQTLHGWLSGVEPRGLKQVKIVAEYFGQSIDDLCFESPVSKKKKESKKNKFEEFSDEINAGTFEVVLRRVKK
jgi:transcriptional regulator with XRE-family HTH domain